MLIRSIHFSVERWREASRQAAVAERSIARAQMAWCRGLGPAATAEMIDAVHELQRVEHELFRTVFAEMDRASAMACRRARGWHAFHASDEAPQLPGMQGGAC